MVPNNNMKSILGFLNFVGYFTVFGVVFQGFKVPFNDKGIAYYGDTAIRHSSTYVAYITVEDVFNLYYPTLCVHKTIYKDRMVKYLV